LVHIYQTIRRHIPEYRNDNIQPGCYILFLPLTSTVFGKLRACSGYRLKVGLYASLLCRRSCLHSTALEVYFFICKLLGSNRACENDAKENIWVWSYRRVETIT
jgi:hypothetical protein